MTSFMSKKKKYKFQVEICLEELLEVPFVSAVLFAKMRLLDGGSFQDHSSRQEVKDHNVHWDAKFSFPCKMMANASTGVMEKCILRISIRKECKGGRSFTKLGFVDLNLAEYAGAGLIHKKALLEGYDARRRQDNSMLKFRIQLNMVSGDILFKAPSPSLKHKQVPLEDATVDQRSDEFSSGSLAGSINSGSSGFGSLPKKRTPLPADLVIGQTLQESGRTTSAATTPFDVPSTIDFSCGTCPQEQLGIEQTGGGGGTTGQQEPPGHSRNSSNTSQMSKASGYSSISHSRQSSSGDSAAGHIRNALQHESLRRPASKPFRTYTFPKHRINIPTTILSESPRAQNHHHLDSTSDSDGFRTPETSFLTPNSSRLANGDDAPDVFYTPQTEFPSASASSSSVSSPPSPSRKHFDGADSHCKLNIFDKNFNSLQKSASSSVVERRIQANDDYVTLRNRGVAHHASTTQSHHRSCNDDGRFVAPPNDGVTRSKSDFTIPKLSPEPQSRRSDNHRSKFFSGRIAAFLTPRLSRKDLQSTSTPVKGVVVVPPPFTNHPLSREDSRALSMGNLKFGHDGQLAICRLHRKMILEGPSMSKLASCDDGSPDGRDEEENTFPEERQRRSSTTLTLNPSCGSVQTNSDTGSLDRAKAAYERRKKNPMTSDEGVAGGGGVSGRVEITRVNPEDFIDEMLKSINLEQPDDSAETSGLQLFIAKDGTASLGSHEVKSQMSTGINSFKQVVMEDR